MLSLFLCTLLVQAAGSAPATPPVASPAPDVTVAAEASAVEAPPLEPWDGSYADGLREIRRLAEAGDTDAAVLVAERLIAPGSLERKVEDLTRAEGWRARVGRALESSADRLDLLGPPPAVRAEAQFARGVALDLGARAAPDEAERALRREQARLAFESARLLAGPGDLRLDATYQQGWIALAAAEEQRAKIPEISSTPAPPPPPPPVAAPVPGGAPQPPDALALARAAYLGARERFIERLRLAWRDPDTQANVELIQRRLRELDEIEKKRKEQEQEQKQDENKDDQQDQKQDPKPDENKDQQQPEDPKKQDPGEDKQDPDPKEPEPKPDPKDEKTEPKPADAQNVQAMSKEEMMQLLERLERIEEVQKELQEKLKRMRRTSVEKDW